MTEKTDFSLIRLHFIYGARGRIFLSVSNNPNRNIKYISFLFELTLRDTDNVIFISFIDNFLSS